MKPELLSFICLVWGSCFIGNAYGFPAGAGAFLLTTAIMLKFQHQ